LEQKGKNVENLNATRGAAQDRPAEPGRENHVIARAKGPWQSVLLPAPEGAGRCGLPRRFAARNDMVFDICSLSSNLGNRPEYSAEAVLQCGEYRIVDFPLPERMHDDPPHQLVHPIKTLALRRKLCYHIPR